MVKSARNRSGYRLRCSDHAITEQIIQARSNDEAGMIGQFPPRDGSLANYRGSCGSANTIDRMSLRFPHVTTGDSQIQSIESPLQGPRTSSTIANSARACNDHGSDNTLTTDSTLVLLLVLAALNSAFRRAANLISWTETSASTMPECLSPNQLGRTFNLGVRQGRLTHGVPNDKVALIASCHYPRWQKMVHGHCGTVPVC
jgi:hypothetical protein